MNAVVKRLNLPESVGTISELTLLRGPKLCDATKPFCARLLRWETEKRKRLSPCAYDELISDMVLTLPL